mmetsp:Transcript_5306/g.12160  ORF Transcript_5306/g.12160 Transcript_5306/m.12160 type:complete len:80 (+) Transcript_5306:512-751(+)
MGASKGGRERGRERERSSLARPINVIVVAITIIRLVHGRASRPLSSHSVGAPPFAAATCLHAPCLTQCVGGNAPSLMPQ